MRESLSLDLYSIRRRVTGGLQTRGNSINFRILLFFIILGVLSISAAGSEFLAASDEFTAIEKIGSLLEQRVRKERESAALSLRGELLM